jgi:hypothetical protein
MKNKKDSISRKTVIEGYSLCEEITTSHGEREMVNKRPVRGYVYELYTRYRYLLMNDPFGASRGPYPFRAMDPVGLVQDLREQVKNDCPPTRSIGCIASFDVRAYLDGRPQDKPIFMLTAHGRDLAETITQFEEWAENYEPEALPVQRATARKREFAVARTRNVRLMDRAS